MNALNGTVKSVVCGIAAMVITVSMSVSMVQATATDPWISAHDVAVAHAAVASLSVRSEHAWFGQPSPAVLVD